MATTSNDTVNPLPAGIVDVTNRDGVQAAGIHLTQFSRLMILAMLARTAVCEAEIGFPCLEHEKPFIEAAAALRRTGELGPLRLSGWCRGTDHDVLGAVAGCPELDGLNLSVPVSDGLIQTKFQGKDRWTDIMHRAAIAVRQAKELGVRTVTMNMEDASRAPLHRVDECWQLAREAGADRVRYCDTVGVEDPVRLYRKIRRLAAQGSGALAIHCHNDTGMAVACSLSAAQAAKEEGLEVLVDVTINGVGERAGNTSLVTFLLALRTGFAVGREREGKRGHDTAGFDSMGLYDETLRRAARASGYVAMETGTPIPPREPGIGEQISRHSSGIHVDAMLKNPASYEPFPGRLHEITGCHPPLASDTSFILGPYSGMHAVRHVYAQLGCTLGTAEARRILSLVQRVTMQLKRPATPEELLFIHRYPGIVAGLFGHAFECRTGSHRRTPPVGTMC